MEQIQPKIDESDSAFPYEFVDKSNSEFDGQQIISLGMSMRDYFAARALNGLVANGNIPLAHILVAEAAYKYADAMLQVREK